MPKIDAPTVAEHHARRRADVVSAAVSVLSAEGPAAVTPAAVAAQSGLARSSVYQYFPSTGALLGAAVEETFRVTLAALDTALAGARTPVDRLVAYVDTSFDGALAGHLPLAALSATGIPPDCLARVLDLHVALMAPLVQALADAGVEDAAGVAGLVNGAVSSAATQVGRGEDESEVRRRVRAFVVRAVGLTSV